MHTINGELPLLNNDSAFVRSVCALSPCIETAFQPLENNNRQKERDHSLKSKNNVLNLEKRQNC